MLKDLVEQTNKNNKKSDFEIRVDDYKQVCEDKTVEDIANLIKLHSAIRDSYRERKEPICKKMEERSNLSFALIVGTATTIMLTGAFGGLNDSAMLAYGCVTSLALAGFGYCLSKEFPIWHGIDDRKYDVSALRCVYRSKLRKSKNSEEQSVICTESIDDSSKNRDLQSQFEQNMELLYQIAMAISIEQENAEKMSNDETLQKSEMIKNVSKDEMSVDMAKVEQSDNLSEGDIVLHGVTPIDGIIVSAKERKQVEDFLFGTTDEIMQR